MLPLLLSAMPFQDHRQASLPSSLTDLRLRRGGLSISLLVLVQLFLILSPDQQLLPTPNREGGMAVQPLGA